MINKNSYFLGGMMACLLCLPFFTAFGQVRIQDYIKPESSSYKGFINVYVQDERYLLEVPDDVLGCDILSTITIIKGASRKERSSDMRFGYGGDSVYEKMFRFGKKNGKIQLLASEATNMDTTSMYAEFYSSTVFPIMHSFPILADSDTSSLVDVTEVFIGDHPLSSLKGAAFDLKLGGYKPEYSQIQSITAFPTNINIISRRAYSLREPSKGELDNSLWEVASSWLLLPREPMQVRYSDERVGYFPFSLKGKTKDKDRPSQPDAIALRWRLEPKKGEEDMYLSGKLVEPEKPIVFYIDRATPGYLVPYFIKAVEAWRPAFEKAGFKNAITACLAPDDSLYSEGDARYSLISYKASPITNAYGPNIADPRTGEILTSHVGIYHSVQELLQRWFFVMCSTVDPRGQEYPIPQDVMGELMEAVLSHEIGHTLGLRHNFVGSTTYPTDSLRSASFIQKNGLGSSIMDYQRFNNVAQPGDGLGLSELLPRIGVYDEFAIEWGYRWFPETSDLEGQTSILEKWVTQKRNDKRFFFLSENEIGDPRVQSEDSGADQIKSSGYGIANLKRMISTLESVTPDDPEYYPLRKRYLSILNQYWTYMDHVLAYVGGHYADRPEREETQLSVYTPVSLEKQKEALSFIDEHFFKAPLWLYPASVMDKTHFDFSTERSSIGQFLAKLLLKYVFYEQDGCIDTSLKTKDLMDYIYTSAYDKKKEVESLSQFEKIIQTSLLETLTINAENPANLGNGVGLMLKDMISKIKIRAIRASEVCGDNLTVAHHKAIIKYISIWETGKNK